MLYNTGTLIVSGGSGVSSQTDSFGALKACAARDFGAEGQSYYLTLAGHGILKGIDATNMKRLFRFGSEQQAAAALTADDATYAIPSNTFAIQEVQLINSDGKVARTLEYVPWGQFNSLEQTQTATGTPEFWTARNSFDDGVVNVYPVPDAQAAATYTIQITVYVRVSRPTLDSDVIAAPRELSDVLCAYAVYDMHLARSKDNPYIIERSKRRYDELLADFVLATEREPTETLQWTLAPTYYSDRRYDPLS